MPCPALAASSWRYQLPWHQAIWLWQIDCHCEHSWLFCKQRPDPRGAGELWKSRRCVSHTCGTPEGKESPVFIRYWEEGIFQIDASTINLLMIVWVLRLPFRLSVVQPKPNQSQQYSSSERKYYKEPMRTWSENKQSAWSVGKRGLPTHDLF